MVPGYTNTKRGEWRKQAIKAANGLKSNETLRNVHEFIKACYMVTPISGRNHGDQRRSLNKCLPPGKFVTKPVFPPSFPSVTSFVFVDCDHVEFLNTSQFLKPEPFITDSKHACSICMYLRLLFLLNSFYSLVHDKLLVACSRLIIQLPDSFYSFTLGKTKENHYSTRTSLVFTQ